MSLHYTDLVIFFVALLVLVYIYKKIEKEFNNKFFSFIASRRLGCSSFASSSLNTSTGDSVKEDIGLTKRKKTLLDNDIVKNIVAQNKERVQLIKSLLVKAGKRENEDFSNFVANTFLVYGIAGCLICFYLLDQYLIKQSLPVWCSIFAALPCGLYAGYYISLSNLKSYAVERQKKIDRGVPDLIDLLVICTNSGLDLNRGLVRIAREIRNTNIELSNELTITAIELEMISDFKQVFLNMEERTDSVQIKSLAKTLSQSIEYGAPLAELLKELASEVRQKQMLIAEERAARIPTLLTLPLMVFILPCLFIVMLGPVVIEAMKGFSN